jgi:hypothetical protein
LVHTGHRGPSLADPRHGASHGGDAVGAQLMDMVNVRNPLCHSSLLQLVQCVEVKVVIALVPYPCIIS